MAAETEKFSLGEIGIDVEVHPRHDIFDPKEGIPQVHGSNILDLGNDKYLICCFGGTREGDPDTAIIYCVWDALANSKSELKKIKVAEIAHYNPVVFKDGEDIHLFFRVGESVETWNSYRAIFNKDTLEFENPRQYMVFSKYEKIEILHESAGPVKCKPLIMNDGTWLMPNSIEQRNGENPMDPKLVMWDSFIDISTDKGKTVTIVDIPFNREIYGPFGGIIQPTLWKSSTGLHAMMRSSRTRVFKSDSYDNGKTWCEAYHTNIKNNNSSIDVAGDEDLLCLCYNNVGVNWGGRSPLNISFSNDGGNNWIGDIKIQGENLRDEKWVNNLAHPSRMITYCYPNIISTKNGFAVVYTVSRKTIAIQFIDVKQKRK